jgi:hypothetical protein
MCDHDGLPSIKLHVPVNFECLCMHMYVYHVLHVYPVHVQKSAHSLLKNTIGYLYMYPITSKFY